MCISYLPHRVNNNFDFFQLESMNGSTCDKMN